MVATERIELRLDRRRRDKLAAFAAKRGQSVSEVVRALIDEAIEQDEVEYRLELVRRMASARVEPMPDPEELSRQLNMMYVPDDYIH